MGEAPPVSARAVIDWPPDDELVVLVREHGSTVAAARAIGVSQAAFDRRIGKRGLRERAALARVEHRTAHASPAGPAPVDDPQRVRITQLEAEVSHLRRENRAYEQALAGQEQLFDRIVQESRFPVEVPKITPAKQDRRKPARSVICPIFDQQFGQHVRPTDTPGNRGGYSTGIFDGRLARWVDGVTGNIRDYAQSHRIEELIIPLGGDQVEGDEIFAGQAWQLELDPCRQVIELVARMEQALRTVVRFAREEIGAKFVAIYGVDDNHGKVGGKKAGARPATYSWNYLFQMWLFDRLRAEPVDQFAAEPGGSLFFRAAGHEFQLIHGHQIRGWGGLPFYGLTRFDGRSIRLHNMIYRYLLMGHHHQPAEIPNGAGETIVSGDWVGANNLSGMMTAASRPQQKVLFVARKWGITETARIYFQEADEAYAPATVHGIAA